MATEKTPDEKLPETTSEVVKARRAMMAAEARADEAEKRADKAEADAAASKSAMASIIPDVCSALVVGAGAPDRLVTPHLIKRLQATPNGVQVIDEAGNPTSGTITDALNSLKDDPDMARLFPESRPTPEIKPGATSLESPPPPPPQQYSRAKRTVTLKNWQDEVASADEPGRKKLIGELNAGHVEIIGMNAPKPPAKGVSLNGTSWPQSNWVGPKETL